MVGSHCFEIIHVAGDEFILGAEEMSTLPF